MAPDPRIIIVGAGIAGLTFAIMLEHAGMHRYVILERAQEVRPHGSAIVLSSIMLRCFEQMGLLPEVIEASKPTVGNVFMDEDLRVIGKTSSVFFKQRYGYFNIVLPRSDFHAILLRYVPAHKILYSRKVLSLDQSIDCSGAKVRCSDNSVYCGDIVVGADGAHSAIRQRLYGSIQTASQLSMATLENGRFVTTLSRTRLPKSDQEQLRLDQHAVVGLTGGLDPEKYLTLKEKSSQVTTIIGKNGFSAWLLPVTRNRICWGLSSKGFAARSGNERPSRGKELADNFRMSEWGPEAVEKILTLDYVKNQNLPCGGTMQDLFDQTEKGTAVKIMLEDKAFKTWYYKRTVLIGDACHTVIPFSGVGAMHAILDCIILANALYDMPDGKTFTPTDVTRAFQVYYAQRIDSATAAVKGSAQLSQFLSSTGALCCWKRKATLADMPESMIMAASDRVFVNRPILSYLKFVPDYGARKSSLQLLGRRDREELKLLREGESKHTVAERARRRKEEKQRKGIIAHGKNEGNGTECILASVFGSGNVASGLLSTPDPIPRHCTPNVETPRNPELSSYSSSSCTPYTLLSSGRITVSSCPPLCCSSASITTKDVHNSGNNNNQS